MLLLGFLNFYSYFFADVGKHFDKKVRSNFKIYDAKIWGRNNFNIAHDLRKQKLLENVNWPVNRI